MFGNIAKETGILDITDTNKLAEAIAANTAGVTEVRNKITIEK